MISAADLKKELESPFTDLSRPLGKVGDALHRLHKEGYRRGYHCGFLNFYEYYSIVPGKLTYIVGSPTHGKTYFWFECLINLAQFFDLKHLVFSPEMGRPHEIYADLISMYMGQKFTTLNDSQLDEGKKFIDNHFTILEPRDKKFSIDDWFEQAEYQKSIGRVDTLTGDPFNEFDHDMRDDYNRQDLYIERQLGFIRRKADALNIHTCLITHPRDQQIQVTKDGIRYYPPPTAREYAGGQAWFRKGLGMIGLWRPAKGLTDENGMAYEENEVHVIIQKAKPRGIGKPGTVKLYFDSNRWRYYEMSTFAGKLYGRDINQTDFKPEVAPF
jgi:hypothetical protein